MMPELAYSVLIVAAFGLFTFATTLTIRTIASVVAKRREPPPPTITPYTGPRYNRHGREIG